MLNGRSAWLGVAIAIACAPALAPSPPRARGESIDASAPTDAAVAEVADLPGRFTSAPVLLPTGAELTADAAPGSRLYALDPHLPGHPEFRAGFAVASALSPDGRTLAVLTSGYNQLEDARGRPLPDTRSEYVFVYDVGGDGAPRERQVVRVPNAFVGLAFSPDARTLWVSGGPDDVVRALDRDASDTFAERAAPIALGHLREGGLGGLGLDQGPYAAGLAVSPSGARLVVANHENDSVSIVDTRARRVIAEVSLRPGGGIAGGEYPMGVTFAGEDRAFVTSQRDRELVEIDVAAGKVLRRARVGGQPTRVLATRDGSRLFVANANSDTVSVIDRTTFVVERFQVAGPPGSLALAHRGANPNGIALSPDERTLFVSLGGQDAIAVVALADDVARSEVTGLLPTGFYPNDVTPSADGRHLFVPFGKSATGPNPRGPKSARGDGPGRARHGDGTQYALQLMRGGLHALPLPDARTLSALTAQALRNHHLDAPSTPPPIFAALRGKVRHVVLVIGENRTYDQVLGDDPRGDGDPALTVWGDALTPNLHELVRRYALYDRFFDTGGVSGDGWQWTTGARTTDVAEKAIPLEYASRGRHSYDWEGTNRNVLVSQPTLAERLAWNPRTPRDPDLLPGVADVGAVDGPRDGGPGLIWDAALAANLTVRNYGCFSQDDRYALPKRDPAYVPPIADPFRAKRRVAFPASPALRDRTDPYFRGFDMKFADTRRELEWEREFDAYERGGDLPALSLVRLPHDHTGAFATAEDGVDTPDTQIADHDYALGRMVERLRRSRYWEDTLVIALEDDAQDGADHVDAHRSFVVVAGGHARRGAVVHTRVTTPGALRTLELLLGIAPMAQADATATTLDEALSEEVDTEPFAARVPAVLRTTRLPLPPAPRDVKAQRPRGDAASWALATSGMDFDHADRLPAAAYNAVLACELLGATGCASGAAPVASRDDD